MLTDPFALLDALIGEDANNPPEAVVRQLDADRYIRAGEAWLKGNAGK